MLPVAIEMSKRAACSRRRSQAVWSPQVWCQDKNLLVSHNNPHHVLVYIGAVHVLAISMVLVLIALWCKQFVAYFASLAYSGSEKEGDGFV
ncbi:hypothetical protein EON65_52490 [archaeon]|nr:MAG: hypothetical protein EON65_52490 [archaeon]